MNISDIITGMRPLRARMHLNRIMNYWIYGFITGAALILTLQFIVLFFPIAFSLISLRNLSIVLPVFSMLVFLSAGLIRRPTLRETAETGDALGLKERLLTSLELSQDMDPIARMQRYDTLKQLQAADFKKLYPIVFDWKKATIGILILIMAIGIGFIPSPSRERAAKREKFFTEMKEQSKVIAVEREKLSENKSLTSKQVNEIDKKLMELQKELNKAKTESDAVKAVNKAKEELKNIEDQEKQLKNLGEKLSGHPETQELGEKLKEGDLKQIEEDLKALNDRIKKMSDAEREAFAEFLKNAAEQIKNDPQLAQKLQELSAAIAAGNLGALSDQLAQLSNSLSALAAADASIAQAMNSLQSAIQGSQQSTGGQQAAGGQQSAGGRQAAGTAGQQPGNSGQNGQGGSQGSGQGSNQGSGQGGNQGSGQNGNGGQNGGGAQGNQGGSGAGGGTSNANLPYSNINGSQGSRQYPADKQVKDYEKIYAPSRLGGDSEASSVSGQKGAQGQSEFREKDQGSGIIGEPVPYNQVYGQYKSEAMQNIQEGEVVPSMRKIVEDYFTSLE